MQFSLLVLLMTPLVKSYDADFRGFFIVCYFAIVACVVGPRFVFVRALTTLPQDSGISFVMCLGLSCGDPAFHSRNSSEVLSRDHQRAVTLGCPTVDYCPGWVPEFFNDK